MKKVVEIGLCRITTSVREQQTFTFHFGHFHNFMNTNKNKYSYPDGKGQSKNNTKWIMMKLNVC
jgi:hypothetical protein